MSNALTAARDLGAHMQRELDSQPQVWATAADQARREAAMLLPDKGKKIAVVGCGTSWFMAQAYATLRETAGLGVTDAYAASESALNRDYDAIIAITRSGTTTEVLEILDHVRGTVPTVVIVGDTGSPAVTTADNVIALPFADEKSVVQTRFATTALAYLRTSLGHNLDTAIHDAQKAIAETVEAELLEAEQFTFLGRGWTVGLAHEAALKMREASQSWTESYPAMEYRHGPISIAAAGRVTWLFGNEPQGLRTDVERTGGHFLANGRDAMPELVRAQKVSLERARLRGLNPDLPRNLTRSVILEG
ncbi:sugar isomerase (SIS) [Arthrobacter sp. FB24]|uniref:SIS domain-containing protein n=1 Tax=Arthrobacter sp. (strain FB24) TaxID=290399 RepID=UPI000052729D|nr:SIS domain-containing protein [Arthrobacter sp. FB24]ABK03103.1 sugar isomerase (SIS) [Arthrobacter sp. FB24]